VVSSGADLFVVCKQCGSEVSPYITECPYCGHRLRRRAPKLPRVGEAAGVGSARQGIGSLLGRGRAGSGTRPAPRPAREHSDRWVATRPHATIALVAISCVALIVTRVEPEWLAHIVLAPELVLRNSSVDVLGGLHGDWWKLFSSQFGYAQGGGGGVYAFVAIVATGLFGWLVERRHGPAVVLALFLGAGAAGMLAADAVYALPIVAGANAGALALVAAWAAPDLRALRAGEHYEGDLLGAGAFAVLLLAIPFVRQEASWLAGVVGVVVGLLIGLGLDRPARVDR
jgi:membrane associated rhomboid family serine protease